MDRDSAHGFCQYKTQDLSTDSLLAWNLVVDQASLRHHTQARLPGRCHRRVTPVLEAANGTTRMTTKAPPEELRKERRHMALQKWSLGLLSSLPVFKKPADSGKTSCQETNREHGGGRGNVLPGLHHCFPLQPGDQDFKVHPVASA